MGVFLLPHCLKRGGFFYDYTSIFLKLGALCAKNSILFEICFKMMKTTVFNTDGICK